MLTYSDSTQSGRVVIIAILLFGGAAIPKLARSLGSAKTQFEKGLDEGKKAGATDGANAGAAAAGGQCRRCGRCRRRRRTVAIGRGEDAGRLTLRPALAPGLSPAPAPRGVHAI